MQINFSQFKNHWRFDLSWYYWIGLAVLFILGGVIRFALPALPVIDADTDEYLKPAIGLLANGVYIPTYRNFPYPCFLTVILNFFPDLYSIAFIQHVIGIITAALVVVIIFRCRVFLPQGKALDWGLRLVALFAACGILFSHFIILMEHSIRPEGLFPVACAITILSGVEVFRRLFLKKYDEGMMLFWAIVLIIFSAGNFYLKPAWGLTALTALMPLALAGILIPGRWLWKIATSLCGASLVFVAFVLPESFFQKKLGPMKYWFLPGTLLSAHADILYHVIKKDIVSMPSDSKQRTYLTAFLKEIEVAKISPRVRRYGLKIDPDDLLWCGPIDRLFKEFENPVDFSRLCYSYYFRGWLKHPIAMSGKVMKQMRFFYSLKENNVYSSRFGYSLKAFYNKGLKRLVKLNKEIPWYPLDNYLNKIKTYDLPDETTLLRAVLASSVVWLNYLFLPMVFLSGMGAAIVLLSGDRFVLMKPAAAMVLYLSSFNFFTSLTISFIHMIDVARYYFGQVTMSLVSQGFQFLFLFALIRVFILHWKQMRDKEVVACVAGSPITQTGIAPSTEDMPST